MVTELLRDLAWSRSEVLSKGSQESTGSHIGAELPETKTVERTPVSSSASEHPRKCLKTRELQSWY